MSTFFLSIRLRFCYLTYSFITYWIYLFISQTIRGGHTEPQIVLPESFRLVDTIINYMLWGLSLGSYKAFNTPILSNLLGHRDQLTTVSFFITFLITLYWQTIAIDNMKGFYNVNKVGKGRAFRALFQHRDVVNIDPSWESQWASTKVYCFFNDVVSAFLFGFAALLVTLYALGHHNIFGSMLLVFAAVSAILGGFSVSYANNHLCSEEVREMYERPETYNNALSVAKRDIIEQRSMQQAKEQIEKERKRNMPLPPESDKQRRPPRKPY
jgi:hypothetical protein